MVFQSTAPYNADSGNVTLSASNYNIPDFTDAPGGSCSIALIGLNGELGGYPYQVSGSTNNNTTLNLQGTGLPIPPPPGKTTTSMLTASPTSPQLQGTSVTLTDTISSGGSTASNATGNVTFEANGNVIGIQPVSNGSATLTATALPSQTNQLTAVYSGDFNYCRQYLASGAVYPPATAVSDAEPAHIIGAVVADPHPDVGHCYQPFDESDVE